MARRRRELESDVHVIGAVRARAWRLRAGIAFGLVCVFLAPMATLAIACTTSAPSSAIPEATLDRMLSGRVSGSNAGR